MANFFSAADVADLNEYATFAKGMPASLRQFRKTINLNPITNWLQSDQFQTTLLTSQAIAQADSWLERPAAFRALHEEAQQLTQELTRQSEQIGSGRQPLNPAQRNQIIELASIGTFKLLNETHKQQETMMRLATAIYTALPRLIDYMYSNIYLFAGLQIQRDAANAGQFDSHTNSFLVFFLPADPSGKRRIEALNLIDDYQRIYIKSYAAASNLIGHFTRLKQLTVACAEQVLTLRGTNNTATHRFDIRILLISLREIQDICSEANKLFQR